MAEATKTKSKKVEAKAETEVKQELPKNPQEFSYRGNENVTIPAKLFLMLYRANDAALRQGTKGHFPTAFQWVNAATGMGVPNPKESDIKEGKVTQIMSVDNTFSQGNYVETFEPWLFPDVIQAKDLMLQIHTENVEKGIAVPIQELQAEAKKAQEEEARLRAEAETKAEGK